jgi:hypothetical protein
MTWEISLHHEVEAWYLGLCQSDPETADLIEHAIDQLASEGPALGRPLVDTLKGGKLGWLVPQGHSAGRQAVH